MRGKLGILLWVLFMLISSCMGIFVMEKNSLKVTSPESIEDVYECAIGNFGVPQYSGTVVGTVVYPKYGRRTCKSFDEADMSFQESQPVFVLADRGDCFFALKAWNAQNAGAAAVLIADDKIEPLIIMDTTGIENPYSHYAHNISIPMVLITKSLGDSLKVALANGDMVNIEIDWGESLPHSGEAPNHMAPR